MVKNLLTNVGDARNTGLIPGLGRSLGEVKGYPLQYSWISLVAQMVKNLPARQETWVLSLGWEDPLKEGMATHSSILIWRVPRTEEPGGLQSIASQSQAQLSVHESDLSHQTLSLSLAPSSFRCRSSGSPSLDFLLLILSLITYLVLSFLSLKYLPVSSVCPGLIICYLDCL